MASLFGYQSKRNTLYLFLGHSGTRHIIDLNFHKENIRCQITSTHKIEILNSEKTSTELSAGQETET